MHYLSIEQGPRRGEKIALDASCLVAGREAECALRLPDTFISRRQFLIERDGEKYFLENVSPQNVTLLNDQEEPGRVPLEHDDVIQVGATRIRFCVDPPPAEPEGTEVAGSSWPTQRLRARIEQLAARPGPILFRGEPGSGKKTAARALHAASGRGELVVVDCARPHAIAETGTLYLDRVGALPAESQTKLLALLDAPDLRVLASTTHDFATTYDRELATRLSAVTIELMPLVARKDDIPELARVFLGRHEKTLGPLTLTPAATEKLRAHAWPGNARELREVIARAVIFTDGAEIDAGAIELDPTVAAELGRERLERALAVTGGKHKDAASALRVSRSRLHEHLGRNTLP
ncbi:MAG: sigma 54-interacting transcriptional regulator [Labilithrix sp.]